MKKILLLCLFASYSFACDINFDKPPLKLSQTCLYKDIKTKVYRDNIVTFTPQFELWSDGASKNRFVYFPAGTQIDTSNPEDWQFPVGTIFWKNFSKKGLYLETRLLKKVKRGNEHSWIFATYKWSDDETEADLIDFGESNIRGTTHDIPSNQQCQMCHGQYFRVGGEWVRDVRVLGMGALQLAQSGSKLPECDTAKKEPKLPNPQQKIDLDFLIKHRRLSNQYNWSEVKPAMPGDKIDREAMGYLHGNCYGCHSKDGAVGPMGLNFRHNLSAISVEQLNTYISAFNVPTRMFRRNENFMRIAGGDPDRSAALVRLASEVPGVRMPRVGTEVADPYGVCVLKKWILK